MRNTVSTTLILLAITATMLTAHGDKHKDDKDSTKIQPLVLPSDSAEVTARRELFARINTSFQSIKPILARSCYDCHSNQTQFPWYYKIPGPKQLIDSDIKEARKHVDFSNDFPFGGHHKLAEALKDMRDEINDGGMPPLTYRFMHWGRLIEGAQRDSVFMWIDSTLARIGGTAADSSGVLRSNLDWYP